MSCLNQSLSIYEYGLLYMIFTRVQKPISESAWEKFQGIADCLVYLIVFKGLGSFVHIGENWGSSNLRDALIGIKLK